MTKTAPFRSTRTITSLAAWLAAFALAVPGASRAGESAAKTPAPAHAPPASSKAATTRTNRPPPHRPVTPNAKATQYFQAAWGVDRLKVSRVASGNLIRFTYRVTDAAQASPLSDRKATPVLYAQRAQAMLSVPVMEKIGALRQAGTLKTGQEYWVAFSNNGNLVRPGDKVSVIIGRFHADGLMVE
jgi:hypothetical protein